MGNYYKNQLEEMTKIEVRYIMFTAKRRSVLWGMSSHIVNKNLLFYTAPIKTATTLMIL